MEKRLFLAVFLSLVVVFIFQSVLLPQKNVSQTTTSQTVTSVHDNKQSSDLVVEKPVVVEAVPSFEQKFISVSNSELQVRFSDKGGDIDTVLLKAFDYELPSKNIGSIDLFQNEKFILDGNNQGKVQYVFKNADWRVTKEFTVKKNYIIVSTINILNTSVNSKNLAIKESHFTISTARLDKTNVQSDWSLCEYVIKTRKNFIRKDNIKELNDKLNKKESGDIEWSAFRDKYFVTIVKSKVPQFNYFINVKNSKELEIGSEPTNITIEPGKSLTFEYKMYVGPQDLKLLREADPSFERVMVFSNWGWLDAIAKFIHWLLGVLHKVLNNWGLSIIAISFLVYGSMYPLTFKSLVSMKKLQALQPKMKELQDKHKNSPEKLNKEIVELYRIHQVNPLGGCLPMLLQMPIFVGLYQVLWRSIYFRGESFLWMKDLSLPDQTIKLPFTLPFLGEYFNILPVLMVMIMALQQNLNMKSMAVTTKEQADQQKMMAIFFPIMIGFIFYNMASGLNLYFVIFYLLSTASQWHITNSTKTST